MTFHYIWPILMVILSNIVYNITTKETPKDANPFFSLIITYIVGAIISLVLYFTVTKPEGIYQEMHKLNWTSFALGFAIIGLETGYIFLYRAGWDISKGSLVANISLAVALVIIGILFYKEQLGWQQVAGIICCMAGLSLINMN